MSNFTGNCYAYTDVVVSDYDLDGDIDILSTGIPIGNYVSESSSIDAKPR